MVAHPGAVVHVSRLAANHVSTPALAGTISGTVLATSGLTGKLASGAVTASGSVDPLGTVQVSGTLTAPTSGHVRAIGTLVLTNDSGSVTLGLVANLPKKISGPVTARVAILGGTGSYAGYKSTGTAKIAVSAYSDIDLTAQFSMTLRTARHR